MKTDFGILDVGFKQQSSFVTASNLRRFANYCIICESFFEGETVGKLITRTRVVATALQRMTFGTVVKRTLCRLILFEQFFFLGSAPLIGWHDSWSDTKVVDETKKYKDIHFD